MAILVSDSSVLIDLERGGLLEAAFLCGLTMVVPDFLYAAELEGNNGPYLLTLGLTIVELTPDEMTSAQDIVNSKRALSLADCSALICASRLNHTLLVGDGRLRQEAKTRGIGVAGLLWLLDRMHGTGKVSKQVLHEGLEKISQHARCRLPRNEIEKRLSDWSRPPPSRERPIE